MGKIQGHPRKGQVSRAIESPPMHSTRTLQEGSTRLAWPAVCLRGRADRVCRLPGADPGTKVTRPLAGSKDECSVLNVFQGENHKRSSWQPQGPDQSVTTESCPSTPGAATLFTLQEPRGGTSRVLPHTLRSGGTVVLLATRAAVSLKAHTAPLRDPAAVPQKHEPQRCKITVTTGDT